MEFTFDGPLAELRERGREVGRTEVEPSVAQRDRTASWDPGLFRVLADAGLTGAALPTGYGGLGLGVLETVAFLEGFGSGGADPGLALALGVHGALIGLSVAALGTDDQRERYLSGIATGARLGGLALTEICGGAVPSGDDITATRTADGWHLVGTRWQVVNAPHADHFLVTAATGAGRTAFLIDRDTPGLTVRPEPDPTALRTAPTAGLVLAGCPVTEHAVLGTPERAQSELVPLLAALDRTCLLAPWLGRLRSLAEQLRARATGPGPTGGPAFHSQSVRLAVVDVQTQVELGADLLYRAAWQLDRLDRAPRQDAAAARLFLLRAVAEAVRTATGLAGPDPDAVLIRTSRDLAAFTAIGGGEEILRPVIAGALLDQD